MYNLNRVTLVGRVGRDPELRRLENGTAVAKFSLATSDSYQDKSGNWINSEPEWHEIIVWRTLAERSVVELKKGKLAYVEGKISYRKWEDKDGNSRKSIDIVARQFRAFETPQSSGNRGGGGSFPTAADAPAPYTNRANTNAPAGNKPSAPVAAPVTPAPKVDNKFEDQPDDDLPF